MIHEADVIRMGGDGKDGGRGRSADCAAAWGSVHLKGYIAAGMTVTVRAWLSVLIAGIGRGAHLGQQGSS